MTYKIVYVNNEYLDLINYYPNILKKLLINERSMYDSKQLQLFFKETHYYKHYFEDLFLRNDYTYFHGIHRIKNELTDNELTFEFNIYDIEVHENNQLHVIFDFLRGYSQNFYLIEM